LAEDAAQFIWKRNQHLIDLPSVDKEKDENCWPTKPGTLRMWKNWIKARLNATITEMIYVKDVMKTVVIWIYKCFVWERWVLVNLFCMPLLI
jgi:hypothetical protein